ncbi:MAG: competence/damage-inducible protein A [Christensenellales bacterium]|jgi:nicotinamide-nucleotide amidase
MKNMIAELVGIGTELLMGQISNTDAQYLSRQLSALGIDQYYQVVVGDNAQRLKSVVEQALSRSDIVITTGGLGPTEDDLTKETIAELLGLSMERDEYTVEKLKGFFTKLGSPLTENNLRQANFPKGSIILENFRGTAPGCIIEHEGKIIIILPGPPVELKGMFETSVLPYLQEKVDSLIYSKILRIFGRGESMVEDIIKDLIDSQTNPTIAPYAGLSEVSLRLSAKCRRGEDPEAIIAPVEREIYARLGEFIYATGETTMDAVVAQLLFETGKKIAVAESCTGGALSAMLIDNAGISASLVEGIVAYSNESKIHRLGVSRKTLEEFGAVSEQTAAEMAQGLLRPGVDIAVSTTGVAGPNGGTEEKPVGLVYIGVAMPDRTLTKRMHINGDRAKIRTTACMHALDMVRRQLLGQ